MDLNKQSAAYATHTASGALATNKVLRNTYLLLSMTLLWSGLTAAFAVVTNAPFLGLLTLAIYFGLLFATSALRNSVWGVVMVFALTGFLGYTLGPILSVYLSMPGGSEIVMLALGGTGVIFLALSGYVLVTGKDMSFMAGFLMVGILVAFLASLAAFLFSIPALALGVSAMFIILMSMLIMYQTSEIIHGGETNYIMATVTLYVALFNLFQSLLMILGIFGGDD